MDSISAVACTVIISIQGAKHRSRNRIYTVFSEIKTVNEKIKLFHATHDESQEDGHRRRSSRQRTIMH